MHVAELLVATSLLLIRLHLGDGVGVVLVGLRFDLGLMLRHRMRLFRLMSFPWSARLLSLVQLGEVQ